MRDLAFRANLLTATGLIVGLLAFLSANTARAESTEETIRQLPATKVDKSDRLARVVDCAPDLVPAALPLLEGERLVYDIRVNGISAGKASLVVRKDRFGTDKGPEVWIVDMDTHSNRAVSLFYSVDNKARSNIDAKGGFSRLYHVQQKEGDLKTEEKVAYKYDIGDMVATDERPRADGEWRTHKIPLSGKVLDPLAAIYYLRSINLRKLLEKKDADKDICLPICVERRVWNTTIPIKGHGYDDFGKLKDREYVKVVPEAEFRGLFERKGKMTLWLDVETSIPLKMEVEIPIGHAEVTLSQTEKSPLSK